MNQFNLFIELTRLKKPIGFMLLFWPCAWGLTLAYNFSNSLDKYFIYLCLFFLGSILMRSAGCIVNDILDRKFDKKVSRTKNRPLASGKISWKIALFYSGILCFLASSLAKAIFDREPASACTCRSTLGIFSIRNCAVGVGMIP